MWHTFLSLQKSAKLNAVNYGPLSVYRISGIPCVLNSSLQYTYVVRLLQSHGICFTKVNLEKWSQQAGTAFLVDQRSWRWLCATGMAACPFVWVALSAGWLPPLDRCNIVPHLNVLVDAIPVDTALGPQAAMSQPWWPAFRALSMNSCIDVGMNTCSWLRPHRTTHYDMTSMVAVASVLSWICLANHWQSGHVGELALGHDWSCYAALQLSPGWTALILQSVSVQADVRDHPLEIFELDHPGVYGPTAQKMASRTSMCESNHTHRPLLRAYALCWHIFFLCPSVTCWQTYGAAILHEDRAESMQGIAYLLTFVPKVQDRR